MGLNELLKPTKKKILITIAIFIVFQLVTYLFPVYYLVQSNSMSPAINTGDIIFVSPISFDNLKIGDVALFKPPQSNEMIAHRVVSIYDNGTYATKGDANTGQLYYQKSISSSNLYGVVIATVPAVGYLDLFYVGWIIRILIIYVIISLIIRTTKPNSSASRALTPNTR